MGMHNYGNEYINSLFGVQTKFCVARTVCFKECTLIIRKIKTASSGTGLAMVA